MFLLALLGGAASGQEMFAPFGIPMNSTPDQLKALGAQQQSPNYYVFKQAPTNNPPFETVTATYSPRFGLCSVIGYTKTKAYPGVATELRDTFSKLKAGLKEKYGKDIPFAQLQVGSTWSGPNDWLMALYTRDRRLDSFWNARSRAVLPIGVGEITLAAYAASSTEGYLTLSYRAPNFKPCLQDAEQTNSSNSNRL